MTEISIKVWSTSCRDLEPGRAILSYNKGDCSFGLYLSKDELLKLENEFGGRQNIISFVIGLKDILEIAGCAMRGDVWSNFEVEVISCSRT